MTATAGEEVNCLTTTFKGDQLEMGMVGAQPLDGDAVQVACRGVFGQERRQTRASCWRELIDGVGMKHAQCLLVGAGGQHGW